MIAVEFEHVSKQFEGQKTPALDDVCIAIEEGELDRIRRFCEKAGSTNALFHIFTETPNRGKIEKIGAIIHEEMPWAQYVGCSTNGNIGGGIFTRYEVSVTCTVFEQAATKAEILQYEISEETAKEVVEALTLEVDKRPWVKGVELLITIRGMSLTSFCETLQHVRCDVAVFGGGALNRDINSDEACVFSKDKGWSENAVVFILYGGSDFYISTNYVTGWKALGKELKVTRSERSVLYELDGNPAYETYYRYLNINNDENFFANTLEFPFLYRYNGIEILRAPVSSNADGSLVMTSDMQEQAKARIAYGDPKTILASVWETGKAMERFCPEAIAIYSCAARRAYWGDDEVDKESQPFQHMAPTFGFFTSSEFLRTGVHVNQHNVTLVIAAMREGLPTEEGHTVFGVKEMEKTGKVSLVQRLATFINAATEDLNEANHSLRRAAITDALTGLYNRGETQRRIMEMAERHGKTFSLLMLDLDNFKQVNDKYGHIIGDKVLVGLADHLRYMLQTRNPSYFAGRWGGEEFMVVLPNTTVEQAAAFAEKIREGFSEINFPQAGNQTMSIGATQLIDGEEADALCIRVDDALYAAKFAGKNRVVV